MPQPVPKRKSAKVKVTKLSKEKEAAPKIWNVKT